MTDTLKSFLQDVYAPTKAIDDRTIELYAYTLTAFGRFLGHDPTFADFEELTVAKFLASRVRSKAAATAAKDRAQIRALWEFAARRRLVETWPLLPPVKVPERVPEAWLTEEMNALLASADMETAAYEGIPASKWWRALLLLAYDSGERATALISLRWRDFRGASVLFTAETRKGKRRDILREIGVQTADALIAIRGKRKPSDLVFPWPRSKTYLWTRLTIILERAGLPAGRRDKFHRIRKTTASYYEAAGGDAQSLLDHSNRSTTRKYLDPRIVKGVAAPDVIPKVG